jgi:hypothetical protein
MIAKSPNEGPAKFYFYTADDMAQKVFGPAGWRRWDGITCDVVLDGLEGVIGGEPPAL